MSGEKVRLRKRGRSLRTAGTILVLFFAFRPAGLTEIDVPWKDVHIGALDAAGWCGLVLASGNESAFAFRFQVQKDGLTADGHDFDYLVSEVGPNSPDGRYARVGFDIGLPFLSGNRAETPILIKPSKQSETLVLEWSRQDERTVIGRLTVPKKIRVRLHAYGPWGSDGRFRTTPEGEILGELGQTRRSFGLLWTHRPGTAGGDGEDLTLAFDSEKDRDVYFVAGLGEAENTLRRHLYRYKNARTIDALLGEERVRYGRKRVMAEGLYAGSAEAIADGLHWAMLYQPGAHRLYTPPGRMDLADLRGDRTETWRISPRDSFFNALALSVESSRLASEVVRAALATQDSEGRFPEWKSDRDGPDDRSQPPIGSFCVLKLFGKTGDRDLLAFAYPFLQLGHAFWTSRTADGRIRRDGNNDGLLEWGSDEPGPAALARAKRESGQDDLPNWDEATVDPETGTMRVNAVDLNSLYALDAWCLAQIADILDRRVEHDAYLAEYEAMKTLINDQLWNPRAGFYFDRHWDGRFSTRKAASNFFPLIARLPDERRAQGLRRHLLDPKIFWGEYVLPTISRDDPAFQDPDNPSRMSWRGLIRPQVNYLVYQGLKAYAFDAVASEFAGRNAELYLRTWRNFQLSPEGFHPLTGEAAGERHRSAGPLFLLPAVEEYIDFTPWEGFRYGMIGAEEAGALSRIAIQGRHYDVSVGRKSVVLREEGRAIVSIDGGAVVRHFLYSENEISFEIRTMAERRLRIDLPRNGKYQLLVDLVPSRVFKGRSVKFDVPAGAHTVLLNLLEPLN